MFFYYLCVEMWMFIKNIIQLIISPDNGWDDVSRVADPVRACRGMSWMITVAALSIFIQFFYSGHPSAMVLCQQMVVVLVSLWATFFVGDFVLTMWLPRMNDGVVDERVSRLFLCYTVSLLSLQIVLASILPLTFAILELWPIYVVVIMWRAMKVLDLPDKATGKFLLAVIVAFILPSQLLLRAFNSIILQ